MTQIPLDQLIRERRAIRRYRPDRVPDEMLASLLECAMWAPSAHNRQPWRFAVVTAADDKERLAQAMGDRLRRDRRGDGDEHAQIEADVARSRARIIGAPVLLIVCLTMEEMDVYPDGRRAAAERTMAVQSVAMAAQNLWLSAHSLGLGACWLCAPLFVPGLVRETLELPQDWEPQGMMTLGWPAEQRERTRAPWQSRVMYI